MKCINCGKFPFNNKIKDLQQKVCENFIKITRKDGIKNVF